jgi:hypothetical protein
MFAGVSSFGRNANRMKSMPAAAISSTYSTGQNRSPAVRITPTLAVRAAARAAVMCARSSAAGRSLGRNALA